MNFLVILSLASAVFGRVVKRDACSNPTQLSAADIQASLDAHNEHRRNAGNGDAANEIKMIWNDELASRAQDWADLCKWKHEFTTECDEKTSVGQNLGMIHGGKSIPSTYDVASFIKSWNNEKLLYTYSSGACTGVCGHYKQVVWASSMEVGCGVKACPFVEKDGNPTYYKNAIVYACDYSPPGNVGSQKPYIQGTPCSECSSVINGPYMCEEDLCKSCETSEPGCVCEEKPCENGSFDAGLCQCVCPSDYFGELCENSCTCTDASPYCNQWTQYCSNSLYRTFMTQNCGQTCDLCGLPDSCFE